MNRIPTVLTIAGSDSSGGAGIQADLKSIAANGGYGASVVTALTAQNTRGVLRAEPVPASMLRDQLRAVFDDLDVRAVKTGMLADRETIAIVAAELTHRRPCHVVCDPVMIAKSGHPLITDAAIDALRRELLPLASLVTPNVHEASRLAGMEIRSAEDAAEAGGRIVRSGARAVLVKGGHLAAAPGTDVLVTRDGVRAFAGPWIETRHTHGTGCTYSAAIATWLARGHELSDAVAIAKQFITAAIRGGVAVGEGIGPTNPFFFMRGGTWRDLYREDAMPGSAGRFMVLTDETIQDRFTHAELARLAALGGADWIQLREKRTRSTAERVATARAVVDAAGSQGARVLVDDRPDVAFEAGAAGVHLGPEDLTTLSARRILGAKAVIGGTANNLSTALQVAAGPVNYLGVGPVFETGSKSNPAPVLGLDGLREIAAAVSVPVFAIGGITAERVPEVLGAGAYGVAVLAAVVTSADPAVAARAIRERIDSR